MNVSIATRTRRQAFARHHGRRGFTLIELLIVMAILVLLVSLVGPRILGSKKKADIGATRTQIGLFEASLERYALDMNTFPSTEDGLQALITPPSSDIDATETTTSTTGSKWDGPYVKKMEIPPDPWGGAYQYEYPPTHGAGDEPDIWSFGPDGEDGTEDDIFNWSQSSEGSDGIMDEQSLPEPDFE